MVCTSAPGEESFQSVTFLYQLTAGPAGCSYGLNVARLAEVPTPVLVKAAREARMLEELVRATRYVPKTSHKDLAEAFMPMLYKSLSSNSVVFFTLPRKLL